MTTYERICRGECEGCSKGLHLHNGIHYGNGGFGAGAISYGPCTALSKDEVIERLTKELEESENLRSHHLADLDDRDSATPAHPDSVLLREAFPVLLEAAQATLETLKKPGMMNGLNVRARRIIDRMQAASIGKSEAGE